MPADSKIIGSATIWNYKEGTLDFTVEYLTSTPYPIETTEILDLAPDFRFFRVFTLEVPILDVSPSVTSVSVRTVIITHDQLNEDILDVEPSVLSVNVRDVVIVHDQLNEDVLDLEPSITEVLITLEVIVHNQLNEDILDLEPNITSVYFGVPV